MKQPSYARLFLKGKWNIPINDIPTSKKNEADFIAIFNGVPLLIEEKTKEDDIKYLCIRSKELEQGCIHEKNIPLTRNETLSGIIRKASRQLRSSSDKPHEFRIMWFTATGFHAEAKYDQFIATLYGLTNIIEMNSSVLKPCYYFRNSDFFRRAKVVDGSVVAYIDSDMGIYATLCLNTLSPNYTKLRQSSVVSQFGIGIRDPIALETEGKAFIADCDINRKEENSLLTYLQKKYKTKPLMALDMSYRSAFIQQSNDKNIEM